MPNLYSRLFAYRERRAREPLEDFLTEAFADLFDRLDSSDKFSALQLLLSPTHAECIKAVVCDFDKLVIRTQLTIDDGSSKRPDMVLSDGARSLVVIETKVGAKFQLHADVDAIEKDNEALVHSQLESYARWVSQTNRASDDWPGAVVLLTAWTDPPANFGGFRPDGVINCVARWKQVGIWLIDTVVVNSPNSIQSALASDLYLFIEENGLMTKYATSHDLAAAMLFAPSSAAMHAMFGDTAKAIAQHVPKLSAGRRLHVEFWPDYNVFWGWFSFSRAIRRRPTLPYVAVGICFGTPEGWEADLAKLPQDQPFFFLICGDGNARENIHGILSGVPEGWAAIEEDWSIITCRTVGSFSANPDKRVQELQNWAKIQIEALTSVVPKYDEAPVGPIAPDSTAEDE